jgi:hypothetical protein
VVERPRRKVRFARLIDRRGRVLGEPSARATFGGGLSLTWLPETYYTAGIRRDRHLNFYGNRADLARHPPGGWRMRAWGPC